MASAGDEARPGAADGEKSGHLQLLQALADPVRLNLLVRLSYQATISPAEFARLRSEPVSEVASHFGTLEKLKCIELAETKQVNGSPEHFYRRTQKVVFDDDFWPLMPVEARHVITNSTVGDLVGQMYRALQAGTFTAREDAHMTWQAIRLDEAGWKDVVSILKRAFQALAEAETEAAMRLADADEEGFLATVALAGFESPQEGYP